MASMALSKNKNTPPMRKKPPAVFALALIACTGFVPRVYLPPEQKATPISAQVNSY